MKTHEQRYYYTDSDITVTQSEIMDFYTDMGEEWRRDLDGFAGFLNDLISDGTMIPLPDESPEPGKVETLTMYRTTVTYDGELYDILLLPQAKGADGPAISAYIQPTSQTHTAREMFTHDLDMYTLGEMIEIAKEVAPAHIRTWF